MASSVIRKCDCDNPGQDAIHGVGRRVHNPTAAVPVSYRCTVCCKVKTGGDGIVEKKKK